MLNGNYKKCGVEIKLYHQCVYSYKFHAARNKGIPIGLLTTAFFHMQNYIKYPKMHCKFKIHSKSTNAMQ